ncbi:uncharacterized protein LOC116286353 [Actinia tenebrosa]|uniref:Uncharacterized protein LOC116286353 n=1 Tax=Actinia tenebrosa TaxID=6105 RepID=A0A6P8H8C9_ACTTE|nr:uncharacterized protein LOC116286353 [Actinia tenebrosa]
MKAIPRLVPSHVPRVLLILVLLCSIQALAKKPHIIMIVADDLGWDDVSFHGSPQIPTPALDALANNGVILNNYYVSPLDTPSRASFMTGKYPIHLGLQHDTIHNRQAMGVPLEEKFLPQYLREQGYKTHAVGKWQLGFFSKEYTPTYRGFDSFFGFWTSNQDYYKHVSYDGGYGLDLRRDMNVVYNESGVYGTELFAREADKIIEAHAQEQPLFIYMAHQAVSVGNMENPLQAPNRFVDKFKYIKDERRRTYAGMVAALDESVRQLVTTLKRKGLYQNSVIIFTTDNGAAAGGLDMSAGSNYPLRGVKNSLWEGGVRGVAFVHSPMIRRKGRVYDGLVHATDWLPTIFALSGGVPQTLGPIDGYNVWEAIALGSRSPRYEVLHGIDPLLGNRASLRVGDYKIILNQTLKFYSDWYKRPEAPHELDYARKPRLLANASIDCTNKMPNPLLNTHAPICNPEKRPCLFNIKWDPCEYHNLAEFMPNTLKVMLDRLKFYSKGIKSVIYPKLDNSANPDNTGGVWIPWRDSPFMDPTVNDFIYPFSYEDQATNSTTGSLLNQNLRKFMRDQAIGHTNETDYKTDDSELKQPLVIVRLTPEVATPAAPTAAPQITQQTTPYVPPTQAPVTQSTTPYVPPTQSTTPYVAPPPVTQSTAPYVAPVTESTTPYVPSPPPYVAPVSETTTPYVPPTVSTTPYVPPPTQAPVTQSTTPYVPPVTQSTTAYVPPVTQPPVTYPPIQETTPYAAPVNQNAYDTTSPPPAPTQAYTIPTTPAPTQGPILNNTLEVPENFTIKVSFGEPQQPVNENKDLLQPVVAQPANQEKPVASQPSLWDHINSFNIENSTNQISTGNVQEVSRLSPPKRPFMFIHKVKPYKTFKHVKPAPGVPEVLDIIDETGNNKLSDAGSGQASIPQIFDIIDEMHGKPATDRKTSHFAIKHKGPTATSKPLSISDVGSGMGVGLNGLPEGISVFGAMGDKKLTHENKDRQNVVGIPQPEDDVHKPHTFFGNITIGGRVYYVVGSESDELARIKTKIEGDKIMVHLPKPQDTQTSNTGYNEMRDRIDLSSDDNNANNKPIANSLAAHNVTTYPFNGQNGTKCEKVVQLDTSDNAVVVSSVVIVVIASAMVVGVAVVAMVAVVARHCQNSSRN